MRIRKCRLMRKGFCINLFGTVWSRETDWIDRNVINHEQIHSAQMKELLYVPFYIWYVIEWLFRLLQYRDADKAYRNISFEREAYSNGKDLNYLHNRKHWGFMRWIRI